jgi:hypothetical protein
LIESVATGVPRIDYTGGGCAKLLLEPQRSNIITYSEQIDNAAWNKTNVTITANAITSPIASFNADAIVENSASNVVFGVHPASRPSGLTLGTTYSVSFFAKKVTRDFCYYDDFNAFQSPRVLVFFNLATGTVGTAYGGVLNSKMENYGNGWYRCSFQFVASSTSIDYRIGSATTDNTLTYTGVIGQQAISVTACQFETGTYITSYIPTTSTAVTRTQDASVTTGLTSLIGQTEGVLYWEGETTKINDDLIYFNRSIVNTVAILKNATNGIIGKIRYGSSDISITSSAFVGNAKIAIAYKTGDTALFVNGVKIATNTTPFTFTGALTDLNIMNSPYFQGQESKTVQSVMIFKTRLSDADLIALTTI